MAADTEGIDVTTLEVDGLLELCADGNQAACEELDRRGIEPPALDLDPVVEDVAEARRARAEIVTLIAAYGAGRRIVGVEVDRDGVVRLTLEGAAAILMGPDGVLDWEGNLVAEPFNGGCPSCGGSGVRCCEMGATR